MTKEPESAGNSPRQVKSQETIIIANHNAAIILQPRVALSKLQPSAGLGTTRNGGGMQPRNI